MSKLRSVNTRFWEDPFIEELKPEEKLLFLYFLTNPSTNLTGIYEISIRRISNDTGLTQDRIKKALKGFERVGKVYYFKSYVFLPNFIKNQSFNGNMKKGAVKDFNTLPKWLREKFVDKPLESFESLLNALKIEFNLIEDEYKEKEEKNVNIPFDTFWNLYDKKTGDKSKLQKKWNGLKDSEREEIIKTLPAYVQSTPDKKFRKNPQTYLNNRSWEDEIIESNLYPGYKDTSNWDVKKNDQSDFSDYE